MTKDEIMRLANDIANANSACTVAALTLSRDSQRYADCVEQLNKKRAALESALTQQQEPVEVPAGATHYQPHQKTYYKRVSATEWYFWSCTGKGWIESKGTGDSAEWICLHPVAAPVAAQPVNQMLLEALKELLSEADDGIATSPLTRSKARAAITAAEAAR